MKVDPVPALLGGEPVRMRPFASRPLVDDREIEAVVRSLRDGLFSRFVGSPVPGTADLLRKTSRELVAHDEDFSFVGGPNVRRFEADWAAAHETPFAIAVNSATSGLTTALLALGVSPGDEVITTALSFTATASAIVLAQAVPVFVDIDPETLCLDPEAVARAVTPRTWGIVPVHWCGNAGDLVPVLQLARERGLRVVEDAAQSPGTRLGSQFLGTYGDAGVFSFSEPKNVMTGEGGMIVTPDPTVAERCRLIRNHGETVLKPEDSDEQLRNIVGANYRMVEATAALGWVQTSRLAQLNARRAENYGYLRARLAELHPGVLTPQRLTHPETFYAYTAVFRWSETLGGLRRDTVALALRAEGIPVATGIGRLLADHPMFTRRIAFGLHGWPLRPETTTGPTSPPDSLVHTRHVHDHEYLGFFLMGWPNTKDDMDDIVRAFSKVLAARDRLARYEAAHPTRALPFDRGRGR